MRYLFLLIALTLSCGEPSTVPAAPGGAGGPIDVTGTNSGTGGSNGAAGAGGASGAGGEAAGACDNVSDLEALAAAGSVREVALDCSGINEIERCDANTTSPGFDADVYEACVSACVENDAQGLSSECAGCYGALERCGLGCQFRCKSNACSPACLSCLSFNGCTEEFETCRGLEGTECAE